MTLPRNRASNKHARRLVALAGLLGRKPSNPEERDQLAYERKTLIDRTRETPVVVFTRKKLEGATQARKAHRMGRGLTR